MKIKYNSFRIAIDGHKGLWYVIDHCEREGTLFFLLESELYGDEAPALIVDEDGKVIVDDVQNGLDELDY